MISEPFTRRTKKDRGYDCLAEQQEVFEQVKTLIASAAVLQRPLFDHQFVNQMGASHTGLVVVSLPIIDGVERV